MPQSIKFYGPGGKVYDMPWNKPTSPTDKDKEDFINGRTKPEIEPVKFNIGVQNEDGRVPFDRDPPSTFNKVPFDTSTPGLEKVEEIQTPEPAPSGVYNKIKEMGSGFLDFGKAAIKHPLGIAGVMGEGAIESIKDVGRHWEDPTLNSNPGMKALDVLGQAASVPFEAFGLPVRDTANSIVKGDYGGAAVSGLASILPFAGKKPVFGKRNPAPLEQINEIKRPDLPHEFSPDIKSTQEPVHGGYSTKYDIPDEGFQSRFFPETDLTANINPKQHKDIMTGSPIEVLGDAWRAVGASMDMSAPLRQGIFMLHKGGIKDNIFAKSFKPMFKAAAKEDNFKKFKEDIIADPMYVEAVQDGLGFTDLTKKRHLREEMFASEWADKIPGVRASGRAYTTFLNKLRFDSYKSLMKSAREAGLIDAWDHIPGDKDANYAKFVSDKKFSKQIADYVNSATGRGDLGRFESAADVLSQGLFAPRLIASRVNMLKSPMTMANNLTQSLVKGDKLGLKRDAFLSKEYGKSLAALGAFNTTVLGLGVMAGKALGGDVSVETDSTSSDFAKLRIGKTRMDFSGGVSNYIRLASQVMNQSRKSSITGKVTKFNTGKFGSKTALDAVEDFFETKSAPGASFVIDSLRGEDFKGDKFTPLKGIVDRSYPMLFGDAYDLAMDDPKKLPLMIPAFFGAGVQTYRTNPLRVKRSPYSVPGLR